MIAMNTLDIIPNFNFFEVCLAKLFVLLVWWLTWLLIACGFWLIITTHRPCSATI